MRNVPELRFDGFDGEWEEHNLSEFISIYRGLTYSPKDITNNRSDTFVIRSSNVKNNSIIDADNVYVNPSIVNTENVKNGDIILVVRNGSRSLIGKHAAITKDMPNTVIGAFMSGVRARTPDFINALFDTTKFDKNIRKNLGATINQITNKNISEMKFFFTDIEEQEKIGVLFKKLDALIEVQEDKVSKLEDFKKSMLQKMFPKKDELVPEFRFDGFDGGWNTKALGDLSEISTGKLDANAMVPGGEYDFYTSGIEKYKIDNYTFEGPSITVAGNGATVGYMHLADGKFNAYQRTYVIQKIKGDRIFIFYQIQSKLPRKIHEESRQGNIPYIVMNMLTDLYLDVPEIEEQEKIGQFFKNLDSLIENEEKLLESYKNMKKSLLQKMFV
ncbi:restriction endonuclease subunit S [Anaerococcus sp.]|uniref:restriction endonuclease subunit S n=1 Tax=Anaerococcus sp. TaxID=1872515 RepID=UPI00280C1702|nr:restriction endonuclease subunit S [Anaerococcus sp.]MDU3212300.1 restriction endonuclease subunit S [Anaerococcus sp.]